MADPNVNCSNKFLTMNIALLGYGRMGKAIEKIEQDRGYEIAAIYDKDEKRGEPRTPAAINFASTAAVQTQKLLMQAAVGLWTTAG